MEPGSTRLVVEGNALYEIDLKCERAQRERRLREERIRRSSGERRGRGPRPAGKA